MRRVSLLLLAAVVPLCAQVKLNQRADRIEVSVDGKPFTALFFGPDAPKPFLHPLRAASGTIVTRRYPMEEVDGELKDHPHQRGLFFAHGDVNGIDFWGNEPRPARPNPPRIDLKQVVEVKSGEKSGSLTAIFEWRDPEGKPLITERRHMVFHSDPVNRIVDLDITLTAIEKAKFGDTKEGTFAIRLAPSLEEPRPKVPETPRRTGTIVNSDGQKTERNTWGKRAPWVDYFGEVDGEKVGVAILDHPSSPRHPTYWHVRAYGLFAANIFGLQDFHNDKSLDGSLTLEPGASVRFRYRVVVHPGDYRSANVEGMFRKYAATK